MIGQRIVKYQYNDIPSTSGDRLKEKFDHLLPDL